jgi:hypothetical protein
MIERFQEAHIRLFAKLLTDPEVSSRLRYEDCAQRFQVIAAELSARVAQPNVQGVLRALVDATTAQLPNLGRDTGFRRLLTGMG